MLSREEEISAAVGEIVCGRKNGTKFNEYDKRPNNYPCANQNRGGGVFRCSCTNQIKGGGVQRCSCTNQIRGVGALQCMRFQDQASQAC